MIPANLEDIEGGRQLTEQELDALYLYLDMYMDTMDDDQKMFWMQILTRIDKEFYEDTNSGTSNVQDVQSPERSV